MFVFYCILKLTLSIVKTLNIWAVLFYFSLYEFEIHQKASFEWNTPCQDRYILFMMLSLISIFYRNRAFSVLYKYKRLASVMEIHIYPTLQLKNEMRWYGNFYHFSTNALNISASNLCFYPSYIRCNKYQIKHSFNGLSSMNKAML